MIDSVITATHEHAAQVLPSLLCSCGCRPKPSPFYYSNGFKSIECICHNLAQPSTSLTSFFCPPQIHDILIDAGLILRCD